MSDNGPYTQPPQYPGGEGNSGGQPGAYGGAYGQGGHPAPNPGGQPGPGPNTGGQPSFGTGGQPGYPGGPYPQPPYGDGGTGGQQPPGYASGPYPGMGGPQYHQANQPPYPQGYPPAQPSQSGKSSAGLWIVIAGGVVIVLLIVAVVVVLFSRGGGEPPAAGGQTQQTQAPGTQGDEPGSGGGGDATPSSDGPPYSPPEDPCSVLSEGTLDSFGASDSSKNITDYSSSCSWSTVVDGLYGTLTVEYSTPFSGSDSVEAAKDDYAFEYDYATDEESSIFDMKVIEEQQLDYGSESVIVFVQEEIISPGNRTTVLIRQDNIIVSVEWSVSNFDSDDYPQTFDDVESVMKTAAEEALSAL